jgi:hypothetical protein
MAAKGKAPISMDTLKAIFALRLQGFGNVEIGQRLNLHPVTISRQFSKLKKLESAGAVPKQPAEPPSDAEVMRNWRQRITHKSVRALDRGLDDTSDNYKAANVGLSALKGLGELQGDGVNVHVQALIASCPPEWRERYGLVSSDPDPALDSGLPTT